MKTQHLLFAGLIFISVQSTAQWQTDVRLTNEPHLSTVSPNNSWCVAAAGMFVHVVWIDDRDGTRQIYYKRSADEGITWSADIRLTNTSFNSYNPSIAVSGQEVHVAWVDDRDGNEEIYYKHSTDDGTTWSSDLPLTNDANNSGYPSAAVSGQFVHVVWEDNRDGNFEIYYKQSGDGGLNWGPDTRLTYNTAYSSPPSVAASGSMVHVAWADNKDGNLEIYYLRSPDNGLTWEPDKRLTFNSDYSGDASIAASGLNVAVVWSDQRDGFLINEVYCKTSTDGGLTWNPDTRLTYALVFASFPSIAISGDAMHVVWSDSRDGNYFEIYYKRSVNSGSSWDPDLRLTNDTAQSELASVAIAGQLVHTVWSDNRDGNYEIYYKGNPTGNPVKVNELSKENPVKIFPNPASDFFEVEINPSLLLQGSNQKIKLLNVMGEIVYSEKLSERSQKIDCSSMAQGIYFVMVEGGEKVIAQKIIVR